MVSNEMLVFVAGCRRGALLRVELKDGSKLEARLRGMWDGCLLLEDEVGEIPIEGEIPFARIRDVRMIIRSQGPE